MNNVNEYIDTYQRFVYEEAFNDIDLLLSIKEICGNTDSLNESMIITEGKLDNLTNFISRVCAAIVNAITNFLDKVKQVTGLDMKYLKKYENIIKTKSCKTGQTISNWYDYDLNMIKTMKIPDFNKNEAEQNSDKYETKEDFAKNYPGMSTLGLDLSDANISLIDAVKSKLRGKPQTKKSETFNNKDLEDMYIYLTDTFPNIKNSIGGDVDIIKKFNVTISSLIKSAKASPASPAMTSDKVEKTETSTGESTLENTLRNYFHEGEDDPKMEDNGTEEKKEETKDNNNAQEETPKEEPKNDVSKIAKFYVQVASDILSAKMNVANEAYKIYMRFIKWHVSQYKEEEKPKEESPKKEEPKENNNSNSSSNIDDINSSLDNALK